MGYAKWFNKQSLIIKLILTIIPVTEWLLGALYRFDKGKILFGLIWLFTGAFFGIGWIIDIVTLILNKKIKFLV